MDNLLGPEPTRLPEDHPDVAARAALHRGTPAHELVPRFPASSLLWAVLAEAALDPPMSAPGHPVDPPDAVAAYAFARTGYHRGLDALRRAGWRGAGPIPADHEPNQGFLRSLLALAQAADAIGERDEAERCRTFLVDAGTSPDAVAHLRHGGPHGAHR
ncbi:DUF3151 domain-containing protein [Cellulomonas carbonis]|uniref:DUF3151 domain-containing protein n=1 Tax=Cellulomonas carbonis T26 TaxID=947969 RepID=A0A0A0BYW1_9CELL|nr:DUF3151 domain-containing protein [Cellulomonas carbonis]KGM12339.1 hypothetical protein N868_14755 [Cellulomonas carbonis T26]GGC03474.1 hypothetical protein GCM10010972_15720 [Cellulomonas carbonis]